MNVQQLYEDFRSRYPQAARTADAKHIEIWAALNPDVTSLWFESLAKALNDLMGVRDQQTEIEGIFKYFAMKYRAGNAEVKTCIDVDLIENLFWQVPSRNAALVWPLLPKEFQKLYVDFHGQPPKLA